LVFDFSWVQVVKIAIVSKSDRIGGGASRVAEDLAIWLNESGYRADHFIAFGNKEPYSFQKSLYGEDLTTKICHKAHSLTNKFGFRELLPVEYWLNLKYHLKNYDIIHFHDLFMSISPFTLALVSQKKPTFFTVHDYSPFTGGCLYPSGCEKFASHCYECPQLSQIGWKNKIRDRTKEIQSIKQWLAHQFPIQYIFPSSWIAQEAQKALDYKIAPQVIYHGIDLNVFSSQTKSEAKQSLNIPKDRIVVVVTAHFLQDPRKGIKFALAALQSVSDLNPLILLVGFADEELRNSLAGLEVKEMGFIAQPKDLAQAYLAADIMLFCSLEEIFGLTVIEAMASSTIVIGFATGGVPEIIQTGRNGVLVEPRNQEALNQALRQTILSNRIGEMAQQARIDVENNFSKSKFLENHIRMYREAIDSR
jgi:glycosyltransferase involved in cell wall biosynthesis